MQELLSMEEWDEYIEYLKSAKGEHSAIESGRRIDMVGTAHTLHNAVYGDITAYKIDGRILYPACDCAKIMGFANPSGIGSLCKQKELWHVRTQRCQMKNGQPSHQIVCKNFIPAEDVKKLARNSKHAQACAICEWILSMENGEEC